MARGEAAVAKGTALGPLPAARARVLAAHLTEDGLSPSGGGRGWRGSRAGGGEDAEPGAGRAGVRLGPVPASSPSAPPPARFSQQTAFVYAVAGTARSADAARPAPEARPTLSFPSAGSSQPLLPDGPVLGRPALFFARRSLGAEAGGTSTHTPHLPSLQGYAELARFSQKMFLPRRPCLTEGCSQRVHSRERGSKLLN